jgi:hypothetical protein
MLLLILAAAATISSSGNSLDVTQRDRKTGTSTTEHFKATLIDPKRPETAISYFDTSADDMKLMPSLNRTRADPSNR